MLLKELRGKVMTVRGPVDPSALGRVTMHEHLYSDSYDWQREELISEETPISPERHELLVKEAIPYMARWPEFGCHAYVDTTPVPWRAWPTMYVEASELANIHIILCTGYYRELEDGRYWVKKPEDRIWQFVVNSSVEELADMCIGEIVNGIHGTNVHAGAIKLGSSQPEMTDAETKTFRAGVKAQQATGVHITTHCTETEVGRSQLEMFDACGADLSRVVIGHAWWIMEPEGLKLGLEWMKRGANFMPSNMGVPDGEAGENWRPMVDAIHTIFDAGLGDKLTFGTDWAYCSEAGEFGPCNFIPPPPFIHIFSNTLPAFRAMGMTAEEEECIMAKNPQRVVQIV